MTYNVRNLADFYKSLLGIDNNSNDDTHQFIISEGTTLTAYNDGTEKNNQNQNICLEFTVEDIEKEYRKVQALGTRILEIYGIDCIDEGFIDGQLYWLTKWQEAMEC